MLSITVLLIFAIWECAGATTRHVPLEYPTIQSALDALSESDTVLVDTGLYEEALVAPSITFVLRGNVTPDTGEYPRPIIDPSSLPNAPSLACLRQDSATAIIEDMLFRSRWPMYPPAFDSTGGIWYRRGEITLRRCVFDSTCYAVGSPDGSVVAEECRFLHNTGWCLLSYRRVLATDCEFQSDTCRWAQVMARTGSRIEGCYFSGHYGTQTLLHLGGEDIQVRNCVFGPGWARGWYRIAWYCTNSVFENNVIEDWSVGQGLFWLESPTPSTALIRGNVMRNCAAPASYPAAEVDGFELSHAPWCDSCLVEFDHNVIENCQGPYGTPGVTAGGGAHYGHHNRFTNLRPLAAQHTGGTWILRDNLFYDNVTALVDAGQMDARWNWWGDSTGPYCTQNPNGQGDSISGDILFEPWHTDTMFFADAAEPPEAAAPDDYSFAVYPNPFNPEAVMTFMVAHPGVVRLSVYNVAGQQVRELVHRRYDAGSYTVRFDAQDLASGIYFVRIDIALLDPQIRGQRRGSTQKLMLLK